MRVNANRIANYCFPLPPLPEQQRMVAKIEELLTRLDAGVKGLKKAKAQLKRYRQAVLKAAFEGKLTEEWRKAHQHELESASVLLERTKEEGRKNAGAKHRELPPMDTSELPELPEEWVWASLEQLSWDSGYGTSEKCRYEFAGPPVLRIPNIADGRVDLKDMKYAATNARLSDTAQLACGDLLVIRTNGSKDLIGRAGLVGETYDQPHFFASYLIRFRLVNIGCLPQWVSSILPSSRVRSWIEQRAATSAGQHNISMTTLNRLPIQVPPPREQQRILEELERRFSVAHEVEKIVEQNLKRAERLRQSILKQGFKGRLVPQDPNDEPAERLLERIKAEKQGSDRRRGAYGKLKGGGG